MHEHDWKPVDGEVGQYLCDCGVTGYRGETGVVAHKQQRGPSAVKHVAAVCVGGRRVPRLPSLDDHDRLDRRRR